MNPSAFISLITISLLLSGCGAKSEHLETRPYRIAVIPKSEHGRFWKICQQGALKAAQELKGKVELTWKGPDQANDRNSQIQILQHLTVKKMDAIALAPVDGDVLTLPVESAIQQGVNMIIFDSALKHHRSITTFIGTDNREGGRTCGLQMAKLLGGKGRVIMLRMMEGATSTTQREEGFLESLKASAPDIEILSSDEYGGNSVASAQKKAQLLLSKYGSEVDGIFCCNEMTTEGMLLTLHQMKLAGKVKFIGFDTNPALMAGLEGGAIHGLAVQNPHQMGYLSVVTAYQALTKKDVPARFDTGVTFVTQENLHDLAIQALIHPI